MLAIGRKPHEEMVGKALCYYCLCNVGAISCIVEVIHHGQQLLAPRLPPQGERWPGPPTRSSFLARNMAAATPGLQQEY